MNRLVNLDKFRIRHSFAAASGSYDSMADLQRQVALELLDRANSEDENETILDVGCGTGFLLKQLLTASSSRRMLAIDLALPMLQTVRRSVHDNRVKLICADAEKLPLSDESVDGILSNLALQWCQALPDVFVDFQRVLKQGGRLAFSTFGPATLQELKTAWAAVDDYSHVNNFFSSAQIEQFLSQCGFTSLSLNAEVRRRYYPSVMALMTELKGIGAHNVTIGRNKKLTSRRQLQAMISAYPRSAAGGIIASYEILFVTAQKVS